MSDLYEEFLDLVNQLEDVKAQNQSQKKNLKSSLKSLQQIYLSENPEQCLQSSVQSLEYFMKTISLEDQKKNSIEVYLKKVYERYPEIKGEILQGKRGPEKQDLEKDEIFSENKKKQNFQDQYDDEDNQQTQIGNGNLSQQEAFVISSSLQGLSYKQILQFDKEGFIVIENLMNEKEIMEGISEIWDVLENVPFFDVDSASTEENQLSVSQQNCSESTQQTTNQNLSRDATGFQKNYMDEQQEPELLIKDQADLKDSNNFFYNDKPQIPWSKSGIISDPRAYHTKTHWKLRQNRYLFNVYSQLCGTNQLSTTIDRANIVFPGEKDEPDHQHLGYLDKDSPYQFNQNKQHEQIHGVVNLTKRSINLIPGSNTDKWKKQYDKIYSENGSNSQNDVNQRQFQSNSADNSQNESQQSNESQKVLEDPWDLGQILPYQKNQEGQYIQKSKTDYNCTRTVDCPPGSILIFHPRTMHTFQHNESDQISYGLFLSFFPSKDKNWQNIFDRSDYESRYPQFKTGKNYLNENPQFTNLDDKILAEKIRLQLKGQLSLYKPQNYYLPPNQQNKLQTQKKLSIGKRQQNSRSESKEHKKEVNSPPQQESILSNTVDQDNCRPSKQHFN